MGDTNLFNVCKEEYTLLYYSERSNITRADVEDMPPYEREMALMFFKQFNEEIMKNMKEQQKQHN